MSDQIYNVLFLCTGNSARSILAEAYLNKIGRDRFRAFSAGSHPKGAVNPLAIKVLQETGIATEGLRSKGWEEFSAPGAPVMDFVFTVCDDAAGEVCPIWPGQPMSAHWGIEDPAAIDGKEFEKEAAFVDALRFMRNRINTFTALPIKSIDRLALHAHLHDIGGMDGTSEKKSSAA